MTPPYPLPDPTADAVDREAAWLAVADDTLPALLTTAGGRWDVVQAYWPGAKLAHAKSGIYVTRRDIADDHPNAQRLRPQYLFALKLTWPVKGQAAGFPETAQRNFDQAIGDLIQRARGLMFDHTHGGRFLSVASVPQEQPISVDYDDPEQTLPLGVLKAVATYHADEIEFAG